MGISSSLIPKSREVTRGSSDIPRSCRGEDAFSPLFTRPRRKRPTLDQSILRVIRFPVRSSAGYGTPRRRAVQRRGWNRRSASRPTKWRGHGSWRTRFETRSNTATIRQQYRWDRSLIGAPSRTMARNVSSGSPPQWKSRPIRSGRRRLGRRSGRPGGSPLEDAPHDTAADRHTGE